MSPTQRSLKYLRDQGYTVAIVDCLSYCKNTGIFTWKHHPRNKHLIGKQAGCLCTNTGYIKIRAFGKLHYAHRLAWEFSTGSVPEDQIDHIDGNKTNNRISNLRVCTKQENAFNQKDHNNRCGYKGVTKHKDKWTARLTINGKNLYLGLFDSPLEAARAYDQAALNIFGDYARINNA